MYGWLFFFPVARSLSAFRCSECHTTPARGGGAPKLPLRLPCALSVYCVERLGRLFHFLLVEWRGLFIQEPELGNARRRAGRGRCWNYPLLCYYIIVSCIELRHQRKSTLYGFRQLGDICMYSWDATRCVFFFFCGYYLFGYQRLYISIKYIVMSRCRQRNHIKRQTYIMALFHCRVS